MDASSKEGRPSCDIEVKKDSKRSSLFKSSQRFWTWVSRRFINSWGRFTAWAGRCKNKLTTWLEELPFVVWFKNKYPGWQARVAFGIFIAICALIFNVGFLIWATQKHTPGPNGLGTIFQGDCNKTDRWNKFAHAFINVVSTLLLMQSNYCMQLLASPTRKDVDKAHRKRKWVDIGIPSFRNVWNRHISPWRCFWWTLLGISSAPLHLLWNSVIIFSPSAFRYNQLTVTEGFVRGWPFDDTKDISVSSSDTDGTLWPDNLHFLQQDLDSYDRLENLDCKREYAQSFVRDRGDVIIVTVSATPEINNSTVLGSSSGGFGPWPYQWLCPSGTATNFRCYDQIMSTSVNWTFSDWANPPIKYCLSKKMEQKCKLEYGFWITILTIMANFSKVFCFVMTYWIVKKHTEDKQELEPNKKHNDTLLITAGDALASFLEIPDSETRCMSIVEKVDFQNGIWDLRWVNINPMPWRKRMPCSWFRAIGLRRWLVGNILLSALTLVPGIFLLAKFHWLKDTLELTSTAIKQLGVGNPSGLFLFGEWSSETELTPWNLLGKVALANTPQLAVSVAYYLWNGHLIAMVAALEYDVYSAPPQDKDGVISPASKHSLRVTNPDKTSKQKPSHLLTLPFKYWILNTTLWTALHYFASQAVFFARVDVLDHWLQTTKYSISQVGYSILGLLCFFACAFVVLIYALCMGLMRLPNRMPLAATCSGALSAACHPQDAGMRHHEEEVHWGVEVTADDELIDVEDDGEKIRRCTFTSGSAYYPTENRFYA